QMDETDASIKLEEDEEQSSQISMSDNEPDIDELQRRMNEIEEEQAKLKQIQSEVDNSLNLSSSSLSGTTLSAEEKAEADGRSVYVGNVDYSCTAEELESHFHGCGSVSRVTILCDKFTGHPKGFAYVEFADSEGRNNALAMNESLLKGRQIKVMEKRTNRPGISSTNRFPRMRGAARGRGGVIIKYVPVYAGGRGRGMRGRRRPYM
ncbi:hypothetical protein PENTCL1PPCAC_22870, partial [Pristionchus entomophagus]